MKFNILIFFIFFLKFCIIESLQFIENLDLDEDCETLKKKQPEMKIICQDPPNINLEEKNVNLDEDNKKFLKKKGFNNYQEEIKNNLNENKNNIKNENSNIENKKVNLSELSSKINPINVTNIDNILNLKENNNEDIDSVLKNLEESNKIIEDPQYIKIIDKNNEKNNENKIQTTTKLKENKQIIENKLSSNNINNNDLIKIYDKINNIEIIQKEERKELDNLKNFLLTMNRNLENQSNQNKKNEEEFLVKINTQNVMLEKNLEFLKQTSEKIENFNQNSKEIKQEKKIQKEKIDYKYKLSKLFELIKNEIH